MKKFVSFILIFFIFAHESLGSLPQTQNTLPLLQSFSQINNLPQITKISENKSPHNHLLSFIPENVSSIRSVIPSNTESKRVIYFMQDVHLNKEAQTNISYTLKAIMNSEKVDAVALEGAEGILPVQTFNEFSDKESRNLASKNLFEEKNISGPIYAGFTFDGKKLPYYYGVEKNALYEQNIEALQKASKVTNETKKLLRNLQLTYSSEKRTILNPAILKLSEKMEAFHHNSISLVSYLDSLSQFDSFYSPEIEMFLSAHELEKRLDFQKIEKDRTAFIGALTKKLNQSELNWLWQLGTECKTGRLKQKDFYSMLEQFSSKKNIPMEKYGSMKDYVQYVWLADNIQPEKLFEDIESLENTAFVQTAQNENEKNLIHLLKFLILSEKLCDFALTAQEWKQFKKLKSENLILLEDPKLINHIDQILKFYDVAEQRDKTMAQNTISLFDENCHRLFLVTGGFHSSAMIDLFKKEGITVISLSPKLTHLNEVKEEKALSFFTRELTPLDKLFKGEKLFLSPRPMETQSAALNFGAQSLVLSRDLNLVHSFFRRLGISFVIKKIKKFLHNVRISVETEQHQMVSMAYQLNNGAITGSPTVSLSWGEKIKMFFLKLTEHRYFMALIATLLTPAIASGQSKMANNVIGFLFKGVGDTKIPGILFILGFVMLLIVIGLIINRWVSSYRFKTLNQAAVKSIINVGAENYFIGTQMQNDENLGPTLQIITGNNATALAVKSAAAIAQLPTATALAKRAKDFFSDAEINGVEKDIADIFQYHQLILDNRSAKEAIQTIIPVWLRGSPLNQFDITQLQVLALKLYGYWLGNKISIVDISSSAEVKQLIEQLQEYEEIFQDLLKRNTETPNVPNQNERFLNTFGSIINIRLFSANPLFQRLVSYLTHTSSGKIYPLRSPNILASRLLSKREEKKNAIEAPKIKEAYKFLEELGFQSPDQISNLEEKLLEALKIKISEFDVDIKNEADVNQLARMIYLVWLDQFMDFAIPENTDQQGDFDPDVIDQDHKLIKSWLDNFQNKTEINIDTQMQNRFYDEWLKKAPFFLPFNQNTRIPSVKDLQEKLSDRKTHWTKKFDRDLRDHLYDSFLPTIKSRRMGDLTKSLILEEDKETAVSLTVIEITNTTKLPHLLRTIEGLITELSAAQLKGIHAVVFVNRSHHSDLPGTLKKIMDQKNNSHLWVGIMNKPLNTDPVEFIEPVKHVLESVDKSMLPQIAQAIRKKTMGIRLMLQTDRWSSTKSLKLDKSGKNVLRIEDFDVKFYLINSLLTMMREKGISVKNLNNIVNLIKQASKHA
ncbi:MAG: hypothetical protein ACKVQC_03955 [Elusimicrobiota bacterium]